MLSEVVVARTVMAGEFIQGLYRVHEGANSRKAVFGIRPKMIDAMDEPQLLVTHLEPMPNTECCNRQRYSGCCCVHPLDRTR